MRLDVPHEVVHEVPIWSASVVDGKHNDLSQHSLFIELVAVCVFNPLLLNRSLQKLVNILVAFMVSEAKAFNVVRKQAGVRMIETLCNAPVIVHAENIAIF